MAVLVIKVEIEYGGILRFLSLKNGIKRHKEKLLQAVAKKWIAIEAVKLRCNARKVILL